MKSEKFSWQGRLTSVQPRIRLTRSFDQRSHSYLGYALRVKGTIDGREGEFLVGIGKSVQVKHRFRVGDSVSGQSHRVLDNRLEAVEFYKTCGLKVIEGSDQPQHGPQPWVGIPPGLETYRERGHRRLSARTYEAKCQSCMWGCKMPVEMIIDHWNPRHKRYRFETFCYGPKSCSLYKAGLIRTVVPRKKSILICGVRQPRILNTNIYAFGLKSIDLALPTAARECSMIRFLPSTASKRNILSS